MSLVLGAPPGVGRVLSRGGRPRDSRTEYSGPSSVVVTGKQGRPSLLAFRQGSARSSSIFWMTGSIESLIGRADDGDGEADADRDGEGAVAAGAARPSPAPRRTRKS